ncbi:hypothetical protein ES708_01029 [subsurface metagenome]
MFAEKDLVQFREKGITLETIRQQLSNFRNGFPFLTIVKPAITGDGILEIPEKEAYIYQQKYDNGKDGLVILKFVPASGAATRMFKALFEYYNEIKSRKAITSQAGSEENTSVDEFFEQLGSFAFYDDLAGILMKKNTEIETIQDVSRQTDILDAFLYEGGMNYGSLPKGLLKFHFYPEGSRTSLEEHLVEGALYGCDEKGVVSLHFTVSPEHMEAFNKKVDEVMVFYEKKYKIIFFIDYSIQKPSTDTIAVDMENNGFRLEDGSIFFRPGGHGALMENLDDINADIIFVKNIDNVVPDRLKETTTLYKKALAGVLMTFQERIFRYLKLLGEKEMMEDSLIEELNHFLEKELCVVPPEGYRTWPGEEKLSYLRKKLNRPIRVCGMVKNEGEPGGGPFWARNIDGNTSLQIVESSQIDLDNPEQKLIFDQSTHFNPVDLVCSIKDYQGDKFNLLEFRDPNTGFISVKSKDGRDLKAQELPGLWNGAMSDWNTIFVEVPIITFNPVKTINDLLSKEHQPD